MLTNLPKLSCGFNLITHPLTLIPLGYFEDLSPLGGGGGELLGPPPLQDLGN